MISYLPVSAGSGAEIPTELRLGSVSLTGPGPSHALLHTCTVRPPPRLRSFFAGPGPSRVLDSTHEPRLSVTWPESVFLMSHTANLLDAYGDVTETDQAVCFSRKVPPESAARSTFE